MRKSMPRLIGSLWAAALACAGLAGLINELWGTAALLLGGAALLAAWAIWVGRKG